MHIIIMLKIDTEPGSDVDSWTRSDVVYIGSPIGMIIPRCQIVQQIVIQICRPLLRRPKSNWQAEKGQTAKSEKKMFSTRK